MDLKIGVTIWKEIISGLRIQLRQKIRRNLLDRYCYVAKAGHISVEECKQFMIEDVKWKKEIAEDGT